MEAQKDIRPTITIVRTIWRFKYSMYLDTGDDK